MLAIDRRLADDDRKARHDGCPNWDRSPRVLPDTSGVEFSILGEGASCAFFVSRDVLEALARQVAFTARDLMALFRTVEDEIVFRALQLFTPGSASRWAASSCTADTVRPSFSRSSSSLRAHQVQPCWLRPPRESVP